MKSKIKSLTLIASLILVVLFVGLKDSIKISTNILSFLPGERTQELFDIFGKFHHSQEVLISVKGFNQESLQKILEIEHRLQESPLLKNESTLTVNPKLLNYAKEHSFYLRDFKPETSSALSISDKLKELREAMIKNPYYTSIDKYDPLGYFSPTKLPIEFTMQNGHLALGDFGYLAVFSLNESARSQEAYEQIYDLIHQTIQNVEGVRAFSPLFYFVENAQKIKNDVTLLVWISTFLLLAVYAFMIKNLSLLFYTIIALINSALLSLMLTAYLFNDVSIFVLAFGNSIGTLAIDYMFHHYFHHHYEETKPFNKAVFYGFLTTFVGFALFACIDFPLIRQLCVFAMLSLLISYAQFAFLFPHIRFKAPTKLISWKLSLPIPYRFITIGSVILIGILIPLTHLDTNLRNLDYQNTKLLQEEQFFKKNMQKEAYTPFLLQAPSIDVLISQSRQIQQTFSKSIVPISYLYDQTFAQKRTQEFASLNFDSIRKTLQEEATKLGFREGFFSHAYNPSLLNPDHTALTLQDIHDMGFDILQYKDHYYTYGLVKTFDTARLNAMGNVQLMDANSLFINALYAISTQFMIAGFFALLLIAIILVRECRKTFFESASYVVFPAAMILVLGFQNLSLIQLFIIFITTAFGIDYGIYVSQSTHEESESKQAILFSLASTFAGFGILIFSHVGALFFMGYSVCIGIGAITLLLTGRRV